MDKHRWRVETRAQLAHFIQERLSISGKKVRKLLEQNCCKINGRVERFGSVWLEKGAVVEFVMVEEPSQKWDVLWTQEEFQIVNKPTGWVCSPENCHKTFGSGISLVHRLDKDTTGALLLAKNPVARDALQELFSSRVVEKEYLAWVDGVIQQNHGMIEDFLAKKGSFQGQTIWGSASKGDLAITEWSVVRRGKNETLVCCKPLTGRTHQIRVHMAEMGHPILVDRQYARHFHSQIFAMRPLLHAHRLKFSFQGKVIDVTAPLPADFPRSVS